ncbi:MAG: hypothetical protein RL172_2191 [Bacteroidota bacterium]
MKFMNRISSKCIAPVNHFLLHRLLVLMIVSGISNAAFAQRFAVVSGNWNDNIWSATATGAVGALTPTGSQAVTINSGVTVTVNVAAAAASLTVTGILNVNSNLTISNGGNVTISGSAIFSSSGVINGGGNAGNGIVVSVASGANLTTANSNGFAAGSNNTTLSGSFAINRGNRSGPTYSSTANITYTGANQNTGAGITAANNLTFSGSGPYTLSANTTVSGTLTLTNGVVSTGSNTITVAAAGSISGGAAASYISGKLARIITSTAATAFPIGKGGNYLPVLFTYASAPGTKTVTIEQFESGTPLSVATASKARFGNRYYTITQSATGVAYTAGLSNNGISPSGTAVMLRREGTGTTVAANTTFASGRYTNSTSFSTSNVSNDIMLAETAIPLTIAGASAANKVYDGNTTANLSGSLSGVVSPDDVTLSLLANFAQAAAAGNISITSSSTLGGANAGAYLLTQPTGLVADITKLEVAITPVANQSKAYGAADPVFTYNASPALLGADLFTGAISRQSGEVPGNYLYTLGDLTAGNNYQLDLTGANQFAINTVNATIADYRTKAAGDFSTSAIWQYDQGGNSWADANAAPTTTNNIEIQHAVALDEDFVVSKNFILTTGGTLSINAGKTFSVSAGAVAHFNDWHVTLTSTAAGTAAIGKILGTLNGASNVTVERYIPNHGTRAWRLLAVPTTGGQTIKQAWQEDGSAFVSTGYGTQITKPGANAANGYDAVSSAPSILNNYNNNTNSWSNTLTTTNTAIATDGGYFLYVRGDRSKGVTGTSADAGATTLRTTGAIKQGAITKSGLPDGFSIIGNPYASAIGFNLLTLSSSSIAPQYYIWDAKYTTGGALGRYQTFTEAANYVPTPGGGSYAAANTTIESGQAFFVSVSGGAPGGESIQFTENAKVNSSSHLGLRPMEPSRQKSIFKTRLYTRLQGSPIMLDGNDVVFANQYANEVNNNDALKMNNPGENFALVRSAKNLAVEARLPVTDKDTLYFTMWNVKQQAYTLQFDVQNMAVPGLEATLQDAYTGNTVPLSLDNTTQYSFTVTGDAASASRNRFKVLFQKQSLNPLPVNISSVTANRTNTGILVQWKVAAENNVKSYNVESAADGKTFVKAGEVLASNTSAYQYLDATASNQQVFYRIKTTDAAGNHKYSAIVKVAAINSTGTYSIIPNPATAGNVYLQLVNQSKGLYTIRLLNNNGQVIYKKSANYSGGNGSITLAIPEGTASGIYQAEITAPGKTRSVQKIIITQ